MRKHWLYAAIGFAIAALTGCSGGSSHPDSSQLPTIQVALTATGTPLQLDDGDAGDVTVTASFSSDAATPVPVVKFDEKVFSMPEPIDRRVPGKAIISLRTLSGINVGKHQGLITFQLCTDVSCARVYPGSQQTVPFAVTVKLKEWEGFQRNAAHNAYVPVTLAPDKFTRIWSWERPAGDPEPIGGINSVSTGNGMVYVSKDVYAGQATVYALNEKDGSLVWQYAFGAMSSEGPAAYADGTVFVPVTDNSAASAVWAIDAQTGTYRFKMPFASQWSIHLAPTVISGSVFNTDGSVYSRSAIDGAQRWKVAAGAYDMTTPASDGQFVYQYGTAGVAGLTILDFRTGALVAKIEDPFSPGNSGYSEFGAPLLADNGDVISFSGGGFSGRAACSSEQFEDRVLVSYDTKGKKIAWRSAAVYKTAPAAAKGVVYVAGTARLDALSQTDGKVLWSWPLPAGALGFHRNVVITDNLVFVSTDRAIHAIDLSTHQSVWSYPEPGVLAISANGILYINTGAGLSDGKIVAVKLM